MLGILTQTSLSNPNAKLNECSWVSEGWRVGGRREGGEESRQLSQKHKWPLASCQPYRHYWTSRKPFRGKKERERQKESEGGCRKGLLFLSRLNRLNIYIVFYLFIFSNLFLRSSGISAVGRLASRQPPSLLRRSDRRVFHIMGNAATAKKGNELESGESSLLFSLIVVFMVYLVVLTLSKPPQSR